MENVKLKAAEKAKSDAAKEVSAGTKSEKADDSSKPKGSNVKSNASEKDLDVFLLGDLDDSDDDPGKVQASFTFEACSYEYKNFQLLLSSCLCLLFH